ncbi:hypothetical protein ACSBR1_000620 [Camellia fascicularis]
MSFPNFTLTQSLPPLEKTDPPNPIQALRSLWPVNLLRLGFYHILLIASPSAAEEYFTQNDIVFSNRPRLLVKKHLGYNFTNWRNLCRIASL